MRRTVRRVNHLHVTGAIIRDTPSRQPHREGATYAPLFTKWIPRAFWPGKPEERIGNDWGREYGYLGKHDRETSFNLPWLTEMFMNFGWTGVVCVNLAIGGLFALLHRLYFDRPVGVAGIAFGLSIGSTLIFVESNLSLMLGDWLIRLIVLFFVGWALKHGTVSGGVPRRQGANR